MAEGAGEVDGPRRAGATPAIRMRHRDCSAWRHLDARGAVSAGAALVLLGLCGVVFFIGPPVIKLFCLIFLAFVGVAALWAFAVG